MLCQRYGRAFWALKADTAVSRTVGSAGPDDCGASFELSSSQGEYHKRWLGLLEGASEEDRKKSRRGRGRTTMKEMRNTNRPGL